MSDPKFVAHVDTRIAGSGPADELAGVAAQLFGLAEFHGGETGADLRNAYELILPHIATKAGLNRDESAALPEVLGVRAKALTDQSLALRWRWSGRES